MSERDKKDEAFNWLNKDILPEENILKIVAKTVTPTYHPEDPEYSKRVINEQELLKSARSLIGKKVGLNHMKEPIWNAIVIDAEYDEEDKQIEAVLAVPPKYIQLVEEGKIDKCSIEFGWRSYDPKTAEFNGVFIDRVDLLSGLEPGDPQTSVILMESKENKIKVLFEMKINKKGEPKKESDGQASNDPESNKQASLDTQNKSGPSPEKPFPMGQPGSDDKVTTPDSKASNEDINPQDSLDTQNKSVGEVDPTNNPQPPTEPPNEPKPSDYTEEPGCTDAGFFWYDNVCHLEKQPETITPPDGSQAPIDNSEPDPKMEALKEAIVKLQKQIKILKESTESSKQEARIELANKIEEALPKVFLTRQMSRAAVRITQNIKKVLFEIKNSK